MSSPSSSSPSSSSSSATAERASALDRQIFQHLRDVLIVREQLKVRYETRFALVQRRFHEVMSQQQQQQPRLTPAADDDDAGFRTIADLIQDHERLEADYQAFEEKTRMLEGIVLRVLNEVGLEDEDEMSVNENENENANADEDEQRTSRSRNR